MLKIHVNHLGQTEGPYTLEEIQEKLLGGELSASDYVWWKGQKAWSSIKDLPGIQLPEQATPSQSASSTPDSQAQPSARETSQGQNVHTSGSTASQEAAAPNDGITVPDFQVEIGIWIAAGWCWFKSLRNWNFLRVNLMALMPITLLFLVSLSKYQGLSLFSLALLPVLMGPWSWVIMEQFRGRSPQESDLIAAYGRAPLNLLVMGIINQLPLLLFMALPGIDPFPVYYLITMGLSLLLFYSINLLVDKRVSLLDSIGFSVQAVCRQFSSMLIFYLVVMLLGVSGVFFFGIGTIITGLIAYATTVFAYLWVFSRESILEKEPGSSRNEE